MSNNDYQNANNEQKQANANYSADQDEDYSEEKDQDENENVQRHYKPFYDQLMDFVNLVNSNSGDSKLQKRSSFASYGSRALRTDVKDMGDHYSLEIDVPGFHRGNIDVNLKDGYLSVTAKKDENKDPNFKGFLSQERFWTELKRSWYIGDRVQKKDIKATLNDGVLTISIPKYESDPEEDESISID